MNQEGNKVTLGIVTYNTNLETLKKTLLSCTSLELSPQIIVLCNSPEEPYQQTVVNLCKELNIKCLDHEPNRGFGAAHNTITKLFPSDWYACCNPDVIVCSDVLSKLINYSREVVKDAVLLTPKILYPDGRVQPHSRKHLTLFSWVYRQLWRLAPSVFIPYEMKFDYNKSQPVEFVTGCFFLVSMANFKKIGMFDESFFLYAEDADLSRRASYLGKNYFVSTTFVTHEWSTKWHKNYKAVLAELSSLKRYFLKHGFF